MGSEGGCRLALSFLAHAVSGVVGNVRIVRLEGDTHAVKADVGGKRALVCCVGEDQSGRAAGVGTKEYGVEDGEDGLPEANHVVIRGRVDDGGVVLPRCFGEGDDVQGGRYYGDRRLGGGFLIFNNNHV